MAVFGKKDNYEQEMQKAESEAISSIIDKSMVITGELSFSGKTRVDGQIFGNIKGEHLILSKTGKIEGDITVKSFVCHGNMQGNAKADIVTLRKECTILGKIEAQTLTVEPGAIVDGEIKAATKGLDTSSSTTISKNLSPDDKGESAV